MKSCCRSMFSGMVRAFFLRCSLVLVVIGACLPELRAAEITVFAAASLSESLQEIGADYQKATGNKVSFNFGASSFLARQIEEAAPADVFFSADEAKMDALEKKGLILKETRKSLLSNTLVIVVAKDSGVAIESPADLATQKVKRLGLAETKTVPAGIYAKEFLQKENLWEAVQAKVVPTENVRGALAAVEAGNVDAGIVYKTDAAISRKVRIACEIAAQRGPKIRYPVAVLKDSRHATAAKEFLARLESVDAAKVFRKFGFIVE